MSSEAKARKWEYWHVNKHFVRQHGGERRLVISKIASISRERRNVVVLVGGNTTVVAGSYSNEDKAENAAIELEEIVNDYYDRHIASKEEKS
jgi:hypothetical protein